jgi:hypothetical protein
MESIANGNNQNRVTILHDSLFFDNDDVKAMERFFSFLKLFSIFKITDLIPPINFRLKNTTQ